MDDSMPGLDRLDKRYACEGCGAGMVAPRQSSAGTTGQKLRTGVATSGFLIRPNNREQARFLG